MGHTPIDCSAHRYLLTHLGGIAHTSWPVVSGALHLCVEVPAAHVETCGRECVCAGSAWGAPPPGQEKGRAWATCAGLFPELFIH